MPRLDIHLFGSPILRQETERVAHITPELRRLVDDMFETMEAANGIGLAAPQVGRSERLFVVEVEGVRRAFINPELVRAEGRSKWEEGCLSIPEVYAEVERPETVTVRALDLDGTPFELTAGQLLGRCLQHEFDHLVGKLFVDRLSLLRRRAALRAWDEEKLKYPTLRRVLPVEALPKEKPEAPQPTAPEAPQPAAEPAP
jgi:peptide deformylase